MIIYLSLCHFKQSLSGLYTHMDDNTSLCYFLSPGGGNSHMKGPEMLVISLRDVNFNDFSPTKGVVGKTPSFVCSCGVLF